MLSSTKRFLCLKATLVQNYDSPDRTTKWCKGYSCNTKGSFVSRLCIASKQGPSFQGSCLDWLLYLLELRHFCFRTISKDIFTNYLSTILGLFKSFFYIKTLNHFSQGSCLDWLLSLHRLPACLSLYVCVSGGLSVCLSVCLFFPPAHLNPNDNCKTQTYHAKVAQQ